MNIAHLKPTAVYVSDSSAPKNSGTKATSDAGEQKSMRVALSPGSQALKDTDKDVDMERVHTIRNALANGTLVISSERIAQGLIDTAIELVK